MQFVILGATGYIGSYLYRRLKKDGYNVVGTSHRTMDDSELLYYDIKSNDIDPLLKKTDKEEEKIVIVCIAESNINMCNENYSKAYDINVNKTKRLIYKLSKQGFHVIFFSSDNVFDGENGNYVEESLTNPINKYGMMKAEMEQYMLQNLPEACILRIPKVISMRKEKQNIFTEWLNLVETGRNRCIKGNRISLICLEDLYQVCLIVAKKKMFGLYNIAGDESYSRTELAMMFYEKLGVQDIDVQECDIEEFNFKDNRPLNISMINMKFKNETGYQFISMEEAIQQFVNNLKQDTTSYS
ncbi:sugar nucleotide-binding protein [Lachnospiraceae bacterium 47-T17]